MLTWIKTRSGVVDSDTIYHIADLGKIRFVIDDWPMGPILMAQKRNKTNTGWNTIKSYSCKDVNSAKEKAEEILENMLTVYGEGAK